jgi:hypothetical protein
VLASTDLSGTLSADASPATRRRWRAPLCGLLVFVFLGAFGFFITGRASPSAAPAGDAMYAQFCAPPPAAAVVAANVPATEAIAVQVPASARPSEILSPDSTNIVRGDVVEFDVSTPVPGAIAVHGMSDLLILKAGDHAKLRLKAIYSGRFPLHFHGADGSHYEVWALNIYETKQQVLQHGS